MKQKKGNKSYKKNNPEACVTVPIDSSIPWLYFFVPPCILAFLTTLVYYPSLHYEFQFDDIANIIKHYDIRHYSFSKLFFSGSRWLSYWLNSVHYSIGRFDPFSYRIGNVAIHTLNGLLIFLVILYALSHLKKKSFFSSNAFPIALFTSLLFLLHPVQTQTVSYVIQGQLEGMAMLFIMSMVLCFLAINHSTSSTLKYFLTPFFFILAAFSCCTKEISIISPALILLVDWFFVAQGDWRSLKKRMWLYIALSFVIIGLYIYFLKPTFFTNILGFKLKAKNNIGNVITSTPNSPITPFSFFISQFKVILHYIVMFVWPFNISVEYDWVLAKNVIAPDCIFPFLALVALGFIIFKLLQRNIIHPFAFGALWFFLCIAPRSSLIPSPELLVDYKTYTASIGIYFLLAVGLIKGAYFLRRKIAVLEKINKLPLANYLCLIVFAIPLGFFTIQRNTVWRSGLDFWANVLKNAPGKARAYNNYAVELSQQSKKFKESIPYFKKAIAMDKNYPDPLNNIAVSYAQIGETDRAIDALKQSLTINPYYPEGYNNLAAFFLQKKDYAQAEKILLTAIRLRPTYGKAFFNLGRVYLEMERKKDALECFRKSCMAADLDNDMGFATYGKMCLTMKEYNQAIFAFKKVLECNPQYPDGVFNLGNAYFLSEKYDSAIQIYKRILTVQPNDHRAIFNLGESYLSINDPKNALNCFEKIKNHINQLPQIGLKLATCHERVGNLEQAQYYITGVLAHTTLPEPIRNKAEKIQDQINQLRKETVIT